MRHFRLAFDLRGGWLHVAPGGGYRVLRRLGIEPLPGHRGPFARFVVSRRGRLHPRTVAFGPALSAR